MREIKFRAWDKEDKVMQYDLEFTTTELHFSENQYYHFMQYTGLMDRNWNDIYEGDIITYLNPAFEKLMGEVRFAGSDFAVGTDQNTIYLQNFILEHFEPGHPIQSLEILGNIHENVEILQ